MKIEETPIDGLVVLEPKRFADDRGFFCEVWNEERLTMAGIELKFVQDNQSLSLRKGTVRGLHYQSPPKAQAKLVRCGQGAVWDVAVDARVGSNTYGHWYGIELSAENGRQLLIPAGFLHGFSTLTDRAELLYKCSAPYDPVLDGSVRYDSADLEIDWKLDGSEALLSQKDADARDFAEWQSPFALEAR